MKIDSPTLAKWKSEGISTVRVSFVRGGCAGTKISVVPESPSENSLSPYFELEWIRARFEEVDRGFLENARLTRVEKNGKDVWLYAASSVKWRCGCGSSFTFDADATPVSKHSGISREPKIDLKKFAEIKSAFKSEPEKGPR